MSEGSFNDDFNDDFDIGVAVVGGGGGKSGIYRFRPEERRKEKPTREIELVGSVLALQLPSLSQSPAFTLSEVWSRSIREELPAMSAARIRLWNYPAARALDEELPPPIAAELPRLSTAILIAEAEQRLHIQAQNAMLLADFRQHNSGSGIIEVRRASSPVLLSEARCPQCVERGRPSGKLLGHDLPVGAKAYCSGCRELVEVKSLTGIETVI